MLSDARVAPTLAVSEMERARRFYEDKLGLTVEAEVEGTVRYGCGGGTGLALYERPVEALDRTVAAFEVEDIEGEVAVLRERGVDVEDRSAGLRRPSGARRGRSRRCRAPSGPP